MLENYDARRQIREQREQFEQDHLQAPFPDAYAEAARRTYRLFEERHSAEHRDPALRGSVETVLWLAHEVGLECLVSLLAEDTEVGEGDEEDVSTP